MPFGFVRHLSQCNVVAATKVNLTLENFAQNGCAIIDEILAESLITRLISDTGELITQYSNARRGGARTLLHLPAVRELAASDMMRRLVEPHTGLQARVVRAILFDKTPVANWKVAWHQDLTIAVRERKETEGFTAWSVKAGQPHVQPPVEILENILTVRVHLDDAHAGNGALRVIKGSHRYRRLDAAGIEKLRGE